MATIRKKIRCYKCKKYFYRVTVGRAFCPYCAKDALVPNGTVAILQLTIQSGGYNDSALCLEAGLATKAQSGNIYLRGLVSVISGDHKNKKFRMPIGISSSKSEYWHNKSRALIRDILNSSQGLKPSDNTRKAVFSRIIDNYRVLNGIVFVGIVGIEQNRQEREENRIIKVLSGDDEQYVNWVERKIFVPAQKFPPPSKPNAAEWHKA